MSEPRGRSLGITRTSPSPTALAAELEELRRSVIRHLDSLETLALECGCEPAPEPSRPDQEGTRARELAAQLENDRRLLAAAWERLERERLELGGPQGNSAAAAPVGSAPRSVPLPASARANPGLPASGSTASPCAEAILRQFQTLCGDVRRTTDARHHPR
ncbi:MAG: hypothetical protein U0790_04470 [Isosphaeraceae bacterium]